jgi:hypothetical protein
VSFTRNSPEKSSRAAPAATPCLEDNLFAAEDQIERGALAPIAAKVLMRVLYGARMRPPDRTVGDLLDKSRLLLHANADFARNNAEWSKKASVLFW